MPLLALTSDNWKREVEESSSPIAVEFWAPWCPWCRRLTPELESLSADYSDRLRFAQLNSDDYPGIAERHGVMGLPTTKFFCEGREVSEIVGYLPRPRLKAEIDTIISRNRECLDQSSPLKK
jgi:thioredoxin 1